MHSSNTLIALAACILFPGVFPAWTPGTAPAPPAGAPPALVDPADITNNGNYLISNCGDKAAGLQNLLRIAGNVISRNVVLDIPKGTASPAFTTFFKDGANIEKVAYIFNKIRQGPNLNIDGREQQPQINCVRNEPSADPQTQAWQSWCTQGALAAQGTNTQHIVLCPSFFDRPSDPEGTCPPVNEQGLLPYTQFGILMHEWTHLYGDTTEGRNVLGDETFGGADERYEIQDAVVLSAADSIKNAQVSEN